MFPALLFTSFTHEIMQNQRLFLLLTSSLSYSASGEGDWGWAASVSKESGSASTSRRFGSESESSSGWDNPRPVEVFFPFGTTSCFKMEAMIRIALTLKQIQPDDWKSDYFLFLQACSSPLLFVCGHISMWHMWVVARSIFLRLQYNALKWQSLHIISLRLLTKTGFGVELWLPKRI